MIRGKEFPTCVYVLLACILISSLAFIATASKEQMSSNNVDIDNKILEFVGEIFGLNTTHYRVDSLVIECYSCNPKVKNTVLYTGVLKNMINNLAIKILVEFDQNNLIRQFSYESQPPLSDILDQYNISILEKNDELIEIRASDIQDVIYKIVDKYLEVSNRNNATLVALRNELSKLAMAKIRLTRKANHKALIHIGNYHIEITVPGNSPYSSISVSIYRIIRVAKDTYYKHLLLGAYLKHSSQGYILWSLYVDPYIIVLQKNLKPITSYYGIVREKAKKYLANKGVNICIENITLENNEGVFLKSSTILNHTHEKVELIYSYIVETPCLGDKNLHVIIDPQSDSIYTELYASYAHRNKKEDNNPLTALLVLATIVSIIALAGYIVWRKHYK